MKPKQGSITRSIPLELNMEDVGAYFSLGGVAGIIGREDAKLRDQIDTSSDSPIMARIIPIGNQIAIAGSHNEEIILSTIAALHNL